MKILAVITVVLWLIGGIMASAADRPGDDFGAGIFAWLVLLCALLATIVLAAWAVIDWWPK